MTKYTEREKLIKKLEKLRWEQAQRIFLGQTPGLIEELADFIIADRLHIVEPLINLVLDNGGSSYEELCQGIEKTLKNVGLTTSVYWEKGKPWKMQKDNTQHQVLRNALPASEDY